MKRLVTALCAALLLASSAIAGEIGGYPNATTPLNGAERLLGDQTGTTVNVTPAQLDAYFESQLTFSNIVSLWSGCGPSAPILSYTGTCTGAASSLSFSGLTTGTNSTAALTVGTGSTLTYSGSGAINASQITGLTWPSLVSGDCLTNNGSALSWSTCGSAVSGLVAGSTAAATTNTSIINAALASAGEVYILTPGVIYVNGRLVYQSHTHLQVGANTTITQVPNQTHPTSLLFSQAEINYFNGTTTAVTLTNVSGNVVNVAWTGHGLSVGQGAWIDGATAYFYGYVTASTFILTVTTPYDNGNIQAGMPIRIGGVVVGSVGSNITSTTWHTTGISSAYCSSGSPCQIEVGTPVYAGVFRVQKVVDANDFYIYTDYTSPYAPPTTGQKALVATQDVLVEGGTWNYNVANNSSGFNSQAYDCDDVRFTGTIDATLRDTSLWPAYEHDVYVQAVNHFRAYNLEQINGSNDGLMNVYGPSRDVVLDGFAGVCDGDCIGLEPQEANQNFVENIMVQEEGGDIYNTTISHMNFTPGAGVSPAVGASISVYPTDNDIVDQLSFEHNYLAGGAGIRLNAQPSPYSWSVGYVKRAAVKDTHNTGILQANQTIFNVGVAVDNLDWDGLTFTPGLTSSASNISVLGIAAGANIANFNFSHFVSDGYPSGSGSVYIINQAGGSVKNFTIRDFSVTNCGSGSVQFLNFSGAVNDPNITFQSGYIDASCNALFVNNSTQTNATNLTVRGMAFYPSAMLDFEAGGTFRITLDSNYLDNPSNNVMRVDANNVISVFTDGGNIERVPCAPFEVSASPTIDLHGNDLWQDDTKTYISTSIFPQNDTHATWAACTPTVTGLAVKVNGNSTNTWYGIATGASGANGLVH